MHYKKKLDLEELVDLAAAGRIDIDHFKRWLQFKETWTTKDRTGWERLLNRVRKNDGGDVVIEPPLSKKERSFVEAILERAEALDLI